MNVDSNCTLSLFVKVLTSDLYLQIHCDKLKAFRVAQFSRNSKIQNQKIKLINRGQKFFFKILTTYIFLVFQVYP